MSNRLKEFLAEANYVNLALETEDERIIGLTKDLCYLSHNVSARLLYYYTLCNKLQNVFLEERNEFELMYAEVDNKSNDATEISFDSEITKSRSLERQWLFGEATEVQEAAVSIGVYLKAYAMLEDVLNEICNIYQELKGLSASYRELDGGGIVRASLYIKNAVGINSSLSRDWQLLRHWNTIRNQVMHEDAKMNSNPKLLESINMLGINSIRDTTIGKTEVINITLQNVKDFLILIDKCLSAFVLHEDYWE
ncbi:hypothetical protein JSQ81_16355 [Sporosarcina sp. Marseille-Q4063]|uniref:hypothetical protein n=1 Tax=Sporosarcina sp. Marseille-Q4063 TaxID=2810514 RepID=UPI001BB0806B|nr:hypothetical protein [Sporosarcina sp. Marseille-Q4063]QUW21360.1 hypothetical protein JSQ81_16355 [Sporosarcina sp. Marseille-Q4063]